MNTRMCNISKSVFGLAALVLIGCASSGVTEHGPISKVSSVDSSKKAGAEIMPETHFAAAQLHENNGHLTRAVGQYRLAIGENNNYIEAYNRLGIVLNQLGRFKEAEEAFQKAIELAPEMVHLRNNLAFSYITQLRWADAEAELGKTLEQNPDFIRAHINLAIVYAQQERFDEAMTEFRAVLPAEDAYYNMGLMYQLKKLLVEAAQSFQAALELNPDLVAAQKQLDKMPPEVVEEASQNTTMLASPLPTDVEKEPDAEMSDRAKPEPAANEEPVEEEVEEQVQEVIEEEVQEEAAEAEEFVEEEIQEEAAEAEEVVEEEIQEEVAEAEEVIEEEVQEEAEEVIEEEVQEEVQEEVEEEVE
ncbi:MAG: tetratricopeptide repeat protein, partial [Planctomycetota bacterium]